MARGFGLRARLIGRGGGGGDLPLWMNLGQQLASAIGPEDPDVAQARQLQGLKIQAARSQLEAQQQERETMAGYGRLGEEMFPTGGRTQDIELGGQEPEQAPVTMPQTTPLSPNERLQKALIQSGNLRALTDIQHQLTPQPEAGVVDLGGGQRGIRQPGGNITPLPTIQPKAPTYNAELADRVGELYNIPVSESTPEQRNAARRAIKEDKDADALQRFREQKSIAMSTASVGKDEEPMPPTNSYYDRTTGEKLTVPTKGEFKRQRERIAVLGPKDADNYDLLATAQPNIDMIKRVLPKILQAGGGGGNLTNQLELAIRRVGGSDPELAQFDMTRNFLKVMLARVETGGVRPPVILLKLVNDQLPLNRTNLTAAQQEVAIIEQEINNRKGTMIGNKPKALPVISAPSTAVHFGGQTYTRD